MIFLQQRSIRQKTFYLKTNGRPTIKKPLTVERNYILRNQDGHYWGRGKEWVDGSDRARVAQYKHHDEASNTVFELSSKDFGLRAETLEVQLKNGKLHKLEVSQIPLPGFDTPDDEVVEPGLENPV